MNVSTEDTGRLSLGSAPFEFISALEHAVSDSLSELGDYSISLTLRNTLSMQSAVLFDDNGKTAKIILDWAQIERLPIVLRALRSGYADKLKAFGCELRLCWHRNLIAARPGRINEQDRQYRGTREGEEIDYGSLDGDEISIATRYALYLMAHEVGHIFSKVDPRAIKDLYERFEEAYPRLIKPSPDLPEELYCDNSAIMILSDAELLSYWNLHVSTRELNSEIAIALALDRLHTEVRSAVPRILSGIKQWPTRFSLNRERRSNQERQYRTYQMGLLLDDLLRTDDAKGEEILAATEERHEMLFCVEDLLEKDYMGWLG